MGLDNWRELAACRGIDPDKFMPYATREEGWQKTARARVAEARAICRTCDVQEECRAIARTATSLTPIGMPGNTNTHVGVFAGETYADRRKAIKEKT